VNILKDRLRSDETTNDLKKRGRSMRNIVILLIGLSLLSFALAVIVVLTGAFGGSYTIMGVGGESFSRASNNLSLIAISLTLLFMMWFKEK